MDAPLRKMEVIELNVSDKVSLEKATAVAGGH